MQISTDHDRPRISFAEMQKFLQIGWGPFGREVADTWAAYNNEYFCGLLEPLPIIIVNTSPYGRWLGCTHCNQAKQQAHLIQLTMPTRASDLIADKGVLLHEMLHQQLTEDGKSPKHAGQDWCDGIMRLHKQITGQCLWATPDKVGKVKDPDSGKRKSKRFQPLDPETGKASINGEQIATWPHSVGVSLGSF